MFINEDNEIREDDADMAFDTAQDAEPEDEEVLVDDDAEDDSDETAESADADDDFEYDDEGNIVISEEDADEPENESDEESEEESPEEESEEEPEEETPEEPAYVPDQRDVRIAELERKLAAIESQGKETLSKLGAKSDDVLEGLIDLAAEADGVSREEYAKQKTEKERADAAEALLRATEFEKKARADLAELHRYYPETKDITDIRKLPPKILKKFGQYRDLGLPPKEAYAAANPDGIRATAADAAKKQSLSETKSHLRSAVPKGSKDTSIKMTKRELSEWRDLFPKLSDKEIMQRYREAHR